MQAVFVQPLNRKLRDQFFQRPPMQLVQYDVTALRMLPDVVHRCDIRAAPAIDQRGPVGVDAPRSTPFGEVRDQAGAPVDHGAEHIEHQGFYGGYVGHNCAPRYFFAVIPGRATGSRGCAPDDRLRESPESITPAGSMDSGPAHPSRLLPTWTLILPNSGKPEFGGASRNDDLVCR